MSSVCLFVSLYMSVRANVVVKKKSSDEEEGLLLVAQLKAGQQQAKEERRQKNWSTRYDEYQCESTFTIGL